MKVNIMGMDLIREAVLKHRGGLENATDAQIKTIWNSLDEQTQEKYLQGVRTQNTGDRTQKPEKQKTK